MNFNRWKIEMRNNAEIISNEAKQLSLKPDEICQPDIDRLKDKVQALEEMYHNIAEVTENWPM